MILWLEHPDHGRHIVYDMAELDRCKLSGWDIAKNQPPEAVYPPGLASVAPSVAPKKRGRPKAS